MTELKAQEFKAKMLAGIAPRGFDAHAFALDLRMIKEPAAGKTATRILMRRKTERSDGSAPDIGAPVAPPRSAEGGRRGDRPVGRVEGPTSMPLSGSQLMFRILFTHQISALEAFLADTAINEVTTKPEAMARLLEKDTDLKKEKLDLAEIAAEPDIVRRKVLEHLRRLTYHKLKRVNALYGSVFQMDIFRLIDKSEVDLLMKAIVYRHDCVHRNGYTKEGDKLTVFTFEYVSNILQITHKLVGAIEGTRMSGGPK